MAKTSPNFEEKIKILIPDKFQEKSSSFIKFECITKKL